MSANNSPISARSVSWWSVQEFVAPLLAQADSWPIAGTPAWCALPADDPLKWLALFDAARHHALRMETAQESLADAAKEISASVDWRSVANELTQRRSFYDSRPWLKRTPK